MIKNNSINLSTFSPDKITKYWKNQCPYKGSEQFIDPLFPHNVNSLHGKDSSGKFLNPIYEKLAEEISPNLEWRTAKEIFGKFLIFNEKIEANDLKQRSLGDCYYVATLIALTEFPHLIYQLFRTNHVMENGYYEIVLFLDGEWQIVILDDFFPVKNGTLIPAFNITNGNELWVLLLEKAWAKVNRGYAPIIGGWPCDPLLVLTGFPCITYNHDKFDEEYLWKILLDADKSDKIMVTTTRTFDSFITEGLVSNHAYTFVDAVELNHNGSDLKLVKIRNPWGYGEWTGDWSDKSQLWTSELKNKLDFSDSDDGLFYMSFKDFLKNYYRTDTCQLIYNSYIKSIKISNDKLKEPQVFNFLLDENSSVNICLHRQHERFNHKNLEQFVTPLSLVISKYDSKTDGFQDVDGSSDYFNDVVFSKNLTKGLYAIWTYCPTQQDCNQEYKIRFISKSKFKVVNSKSDSNFELIRAMITAGVKEDFKSDLAKDKWAVKIDNSYKNTGISYFHVNNQYSEFFFKYQVNTSEMRDILILPPHKPANGDTFDFKVPPNGSTTVLGIRTHNLGWLNLKCESDSDHCKIGENPTKLSLYKIHPEKYVCHTNFINERVSHKNYYDYSFLSVSEAKEEMHFEKIDENELYLENLRKEFPNFMQLLDEIEAYPDESELTWGKNTYEDSTYVGQKNKQGERHGKGLYHWQSCDQIYVGYWEHGNRENYGKMLLSNRITYEGGWLNGNYNGKGSYHYSNGDIYRGFYKDGNRNGKGTFIWSDGSKWEGNYVDDLRIGIGMFYPVQGEPYEYQFD